MRLKREHEKKCYVPPPHSGWIHERVNALDYVKRRVPQTLAADRDDACTTGQIGSWYEKIKKTVDPER